MIEKFIISLYWNDCNCFSIDLAWYEIFKYRQNMDSRSLPLTRDVLMHYIHKSAYVSRHIWGGANLPNNTDESLSNWTWSIRNDEIFYTGTSANNILFLQSLVKL